MAHQRSDVGAAGYRRRAQHQDQRHCGRALRDAEYRGNSQRQQRQGNLQQSNGFDSANPVCQPASGFAEANPVCIQKQKPGHHIRQPGLKGSGEAGQKQPGQKPQNQGGPPMPGGKGERAHQVSRPVRA